MPDTSTRTNVIGGTTLSVGVDPDPVRTLREWAGKARDADRLDVGPVFARAVVARVAVLNHDLHVALNDRERGVLALEEMRTALRRALAALRIAEPKEARAIEADFAALLAAQGET